MSYLSGVVGLALTDLVLMVYPWDSLQTSIPICCICTHCTQLAQHQFKNTPAFGILPQKFSSVRSNAKGRAMQKPATARCLYFVRQRVLRPERQERRSSLGSETTFWPRSPVSAFTPHLPS